jgi:hypothetical protein
MIRIVIRVRKPKESDFLAPKLTTKMGAIKLASVPESSKRNVR